MMLRTRVIRLVTMLLGGLVALAAVAAPAFAHAHLERSDPVDGSVLTVAPSRVELEFSGDVQPAGDALWLTSWDGTSVALDASVTGAVVTAPLPGPLPDGSYTVSYRVTSADGHPAEGELRFGIGTGAASPPPPGPQPHGGSSATGALVVLLTGLQYLGLLAFVGLLLFQWLAQRPPRTAPPRALRWTLGTGVVASFLLLPAGALRILGAQPWEIVRVGAWLAAVAWPAAVAAGLSIVAGGGALWLTGGLPHRTESPGIDRGRALPALAGLLVLAGPLLAGHSQTVEPRWLILVADLGHLLAAACWFGGLWGLLGELAHVRRLPRPQRDAATPGLSRTVTRFSGLALVAVGLLAASGLVMATLTLGSVEALIGTGYGRTLLLKLGIVAPVVAIAGWNRFMLLPRILRQPVPGQWDALARTLRSEAALVIAVLAVTGVLTNLPLE